MSWIQTFSGKRLDLHDPQPDQINLADIAFPLSRLPRFVGATQTLRHYSVAEHSLLVASTVRSELALEALLHDAHEAYVSDIPSPVRQFLGDDFRKLEARLIAVVRAWAGLPDGPLHEEVKLADLRALATEKRDLMAPEPAPWAIPEDIAPFLANVQQARDEIAARHKFMAKFHELKAKQK